MLVSPKANTIYFSQTETPIYDQCVYCKQCAAVMHLGLDSSGANTMFGIGFVETLIIPKGANNVIHTKLQAT